MTHPESNSWSVFLKIEQIIKVLSMHFKLITGRQLKKSCPYVFFAQWGVK